MEKPYGFHAMETDQREPTTREKITYLSLNEIDELIKAMQERRAVDEAEYYEVVQRRIELWEQDQL